MGTETNSKIILLFLKWLKQKYTVTNLKINFTNENVITLLKYFQFLLKILTNYQIINKKLVQLPRFDTQSVSKKIPKLSDNQFKTLIRLYTKTIFNSQVVLVTEHLINWFFDIQTFSFLKQNINKLLVRKTNLDKLIQFSTFRPTLYFSTSLKDQLKYLFGQ